MAYTQRRPPLVCGAGRPERRVSRLHQVCPNRSFHGLSPDMSACDAGRNSSSNRLTCLSSFSEMTNLLQSSLGPSVQIDTHFALRLPKALADPNPADAHPAAECTCAHGGGCTLGVHTGQTRQPGSGFCHRKCSPSPSPARQGRQKHRRKIASQKVATTNGRVKTRHRKRRRRPVPHSPLFRSSGEGLGSDLVAAPQSGWRMPNFAPLPCGASSILEPTAGRAVDAPGLSGSLWIGLLCP